LIAHSGVPAERARHCRWRPAGPRAASFWPIGSTACRPVHAMSNTAWQTARKKPGPG